MKNKTIKEMAKEYNIKVPKEYVGNFDMETGKPFEEDVMTLKAKLTNMTTSSDEKGQRGMALVMNDTAGICGMDCWIPGKNGQKCEKVFKKELDLIENAEIYDFVLECFDKFCPDYFWTAPSSTTGKWHPKYAQGKGGIVRHTKSAVWWGLELMKPFSIPEEHKSVIVAALILHDLRKNGDSLEEKAEKGYEITKTHGVDLAKKIIEDRGLSNYYTTSPEWKLQITRAIASHMGPWSEPLTASPVMIRQAFLKQSSGLIFSEAESIKEQIALIVHLADFCASRKVDEMVKLIKK